MKKKKAYLELFGKNNIFKLLVFINKFLKYYFRFKWLENLNNANYGSIDDYLNQKLR
jgi:hypothetical protein